MREPGVIRTALGLEVAPWHPCDRCPHLLRRHLGPSGEEFLLRGSRCLAKNCLCDGYFPAPGEQAEEAIA